MKRIGIVGHFGRDLPFYDGQTVKTRNFYRAVMQKYSDSDVEHLDTYGFRERCVPFFFDTVKLIFRCENVVALPDENGIRVFIPLYGFLNLFLKRKLYYNVIGGWLPVFTKKHPIVRWFAKRFSAIYVETASMKAALEEQGFRNIFVIPNFKFITPLSLEELQKAYTKPYKLCTFSRVMEEKGIEDAIEAVKHINGKLGQRALELDIYGKVDPAYEARFQQVIAEMPDYVRYCGMVDPEQSVEALKDYFALLFPTRFYTEGIPGTIIDAYAAGVPVISAKWQSFADVIDDTQTGYGFEFGSTEAFQNLLLEVTTQPEKIISLKENCIRKAQDYTPESAMEILLRHVEG